MNILYLTSLAKVLLCATILSLASFEDWRTREVRDLLWILMGTTCGVLTVVEILMSHSFERIIIAAMSAGVCLAAGILLYYAGFFGGADAKCLWCLGVALPYNPMEYLGFSTPGAQSPIFSLSIFNNSILTAAALAFGIACFNLARRLRGPLFSEGEEGSVFKRVVVLLLGYKMSISRALRKRNFYFLLEELRMRNGGVDRRFRLFTRCSDDSLYPTLEEMVKRGIVREDGGIWVSPAVPLIVNMTIGLVIALLYGDLIMSIAKELLRSIL
ncbi:MAG: prepilin peptidase [Candidatus Nezhaarchaeota archaeon]|nr:prepilin peptidase [Candidatus Nezhaarchaeota archaeon]MCX8142217.1 prepilin peptidase [Candidatus Nezhaarchaeota archaeon]MDW8050810.1 A24 family peptidase C-terminal domain-containing protein [Nitrososphaerota archaeon]